MIGYSITSFLVESTAFSKPRIFLTSRSTFLKKLLSCMYCTGFWAGCLLHFLWSPTAEYFCNELWIINTILDGFFIAATTWFLYKIDERLTV